MNKKQLFMISAIMLATSIVFAQSSTTAYSWQSTSGIVNEAGGTIEQHNNLDVNHVNVLSSGYYAIQLCGKKENMSATDDSPASVYFTITLANGHTFKAGDKVSITAMRNNDAGGESNLHFVYNDGTLTEPVAYDDTNTWNNLGQLHEENTDQGGSGSSQGGASTEPLHVYSLNPSTNTFLVPEAADGSTTLTLTRNESECLLYITRINITREAATEITNIKENRAYPELCRSAKVLEHGHVVIQKNGLKYNLSGQEEISLR